ncbi:MAG: CoA transferase [Rhodoglobus sp.]|nr:CoA transferase [Rhodoglobus sp.]
MRLAAQLAGIRVVSLEQYISAPYCTQILAEAGAEVIKIERPDGGDPRRTYDPLVDVDGHLISGGFASYNRGKLSVTLDITQDEGRDALLSLLETADVFVSNLRPGALARRGLAPDLLRERFPSLIVCELSGFGTAGGPMDDWPAFDSVIQAMSGMSGLIGVAPDEPPLLAPMSVMDILSGIWGAVGILTALHGRQRTGQGTHIDAAMYDAGVAFMERAVTLAAFSGETPVRGVDRFSPVGSFQAADGRWLSIVIPTEEMWRRCCSAIDRIELVNHPELDSVLKRAERMHDLVLPALHDWAVDGGLGAEEAARRLRAAGQPVGIVQSIDEVMRSDQLLSRDMFWPLAPGSEIRLPRIPLVFDGAGSAPGLVPRLGEHNSRVLDREIPQ